MKNQIDCTTTGTKPDDTAPPTMKLDSSPILSGEEQAGLPHATFVHTPVAAASGANPDCWQAHPDSMKGGQNNE